VFWHRGRRWYKDKLYFRERTLVCSDYGDSMVERSYQSSGELSDLGIYHSGAGAKGRMDRAATHRPSVVFPFARTCYGVACRRPRFICSLSLLNAALIVMCKF